jgi:hypothetical protein
MHYSNLIKALGIDDVDAETCPGSGKEGGDGRSSVLKEETAMRVLSDWLGAIRYPWRREIQAGAVR